jgi:WD40 repeat protein
LAASSSDSEAVKLWDVHTREAVLDLPGKGTVFWYPTFSPDGNMIMALNDQGALHVWRAPTWQEIKRAESTRRPFQ